MNENQSRTYTFPGTCESVAYHLYVPETWNKTTSLALLIFLHGEGQGPEAPFRMSSGVLGKMSEERGYIVASVLGYRSNGDFNNPFKLVTAPPPHSRRPLAERAGCPQCRRAGSEGISFDASLRMVELAREHNLDVQWIPVKGNHFEAWAPAAAQVFDFFDQHKKK